MLTTKNIVKIIPMIKTAVKLETIVTIIVIKYLHQLFLPDSALYKKGICDIIIPPELVYTIFKLLI
jgi:hypothetical protein